VIGAAIQSFDHGDFADAMQKVRFLQEEYTDIPPVRKLTIDLFSESITGAILLKQGKTREGAGKLFKVLSNTQWGLLLNTSYGYPRYILLTAAGLSQRAGHQKDAAELYRRLAGLYGSFEPMESEFYLALASLCQNDRTTALRHFENAQKLSPHDENIRKNIEILKRQRQ
jgi:tetratricopeptide (TPR) repeat protein